MKAKFSKIFFALSFAAAGLAGVSCEKPENKDDGNGNGNGGGTQEPEIEVTLSYEAAGQGKIDDEVTIESGFEGKIIELDSESEHVANKLKIYKTPTAVITPAVEGLAVSGYEFSSITLDGEYFDNEAVNNLFSINPVSGQITLYTSKLGTNYGTFSVSVNATVSDKKYETKDALIVKYVKGEVEIKSAELSYIDEGNWSTGSGDDRVTGTEESFKSDEITLESTSEFIGRRIEKRPTLVVDPSDRNLKVDEESYKIASVKKDGADYQDPDNLFGINSKSGQLTVYTSKFKEAHAGTYTVSVSFEINGQPFTTENALTFTYVYVKPTPKVSYEAPGKVNNVADEKFAGSTISFDTNFKTAISKPASVSNGPAEKNTFKITRVLFNDADFDLTVQADKPIFAVNTGSGTLSINCGRFKPEHLGTWKVSVSFKVQGDENLYTTEDALTVIYKNAEETPAE